MGGAIGLRNQGANVRMKYRELVEFTGNSNLPDAMKWANAGLGLTGEAGEVADLIKKFVMHGHTLEKDKLIKELGDVRWYLELACILAGTTMEEVEQRNIEKLMARYPNGFSTEASINRPGKEL